MGNPFEGLFDSGDVLERVGIDLTAQARRGDLEPVKCRDAEIERVVDILLRQGKNNAALVGKAGVGKTAVVEGLAQRIAEGNVPPALKDARILGLDHVSMLAGTSFRGQYEERIRRLVQALQADRNLILFVDELHNLIGQGTATSASSARPPAKNTPSGSKPIRRSSVAFSRSRSKSWTRSRRGRSWWPAGRGSSAIMPWRLRTTRSRRRSS